MANFIQGAQLRKLLFGLKVSRAAATLPSSTLGNIFTVTGGRVLLVSLTGTVVTTLSGTNATTVGVTPTAAGATSAPAALSAAGTIPVTVGCSVSSKLDGAVMVVTPAGALIAPTPYLALPGVVTITTASTVTGTMSWDLIYVPYDTGASVVAA
jgi:hypothetical protein